MSLFCNEIANVFLEILLDEDCEVSEFIILAFIHIMQGGLAENYGSY